MPIVGTNSGPFRCLLVGVGGQGVRKAAAVLGDAATTAGLDVRVGALYGMSQRGGSTQNTVLIGPGSTSFLGEGAADLVVGFEPLETQRALPLMSERTRVVLNTGRVVPFSVTAGGTEYPPLDRITEKIRRITSRITTVDALAAAHEAGDARTLNIVMMGVVAELEVLPISVEALVESIRRQWPNAALAANRCTFRLGMRAVTTATETG